MGVTFLVLGNMGGRGPAKVGPRLVGELPGDALADDLLTLAELESFTMLLFAAPDLRRPDGGDPVSLERDQGISYPARPAAAT